MSSPPIAAHRLLGDGSATALLRPAGEIDWWCAPEMDDPPVLWSLLDPEGAAARWLDVRLASAAGKAAGPVLDTGCSPRAAGCSAAMGCTAPTTAAPR